MCRCRFVSRACAGHPTAGLPSDRAAATLRLRGPRLSRPPRARLVTGRTHVSTAGYSSGLVILDGACLYCKLRHPAGDSYHFLSEHSDYKIDRDGHMVSGEAAEMFTEH
eukprot:336946-Pyramimonas_sp.AAC.1